MATNPGEPNEVDKAASAACIRSGAFALLLSVVLFLLVPYWKNDSNYVALRKYVTNRLNLVGALDTLDDSILWQKYKGSHEATDSMSIAQLQTARAELSTESAGPPATPPKPKRAPQTDANPKTQHARSLDGRPAPPTLLTVKAVDQMEIGELSRIADALRSLNDSDTLNRARKVSNFFDMSIVRWSNKRNTLAYRNAITSHCTTNELWVIPSGKRPEEFIQALTEEALLKCLTLRDVQTLAQLELPTLSNPIQLGGRTAEVIDITPGSLPRDLFTASFLAQAFLIFLAVYFGAFAREAVVSPDFPVPGTLFGAFAGSRWTRLTLLLALWVPFVASVVVAGYSHKPSLWACSVLVGLAILPVHILLQRKSYFLGDFRFRRMRWAGGPPERVE